MWHKRRRRPACERSGDAQIPGPARKTDRCLKIQGIFPCPPRRDPRRPRRPGVVPGTARRARRARPCRAVRRRGRRPRARSPARLRAGARAASRGRYAPGQRGAAGRAGPRSRRTGRAARRAGRTTAVYCNLHADRTGMHSTPSGQEPAGVELAVRFRCSAYSDVLQHTQY